MPCLFKNRKKGVNIKLEDVDFMKQYKVISNDEIEARYLITPSFMERFAKLVTVFKSYKSECSFYNDKLMIAIDTSKDLFEIGSLKKPLTDIETVAPCYRELKSIFDMIDYFKLDQKTGL